MTANALLFLIFSDLDNILSIIRALKKRPPLKLKTATKSQVYLSKNA
jgi:hypothetical protein